MIPATDLPDEIILYTGLAQIEAGTGRVAQIQAAANSLSSGVRRYARGDILFARLRPNLRKVALIEFERPGYASAEWLVLTVNPDSSGAPVIDPFLLATLLRSDDVFGQVMHLVAGIGRPRLNRKDVLGIRIPVPPRAVQIQINNAFHERRACYESMRQEARKLSEDADKAARAAVDALVRQFVG